MRHVILNFHGLGTPGRVLEDGESPYWLQPEVFQAILDLAHRLRDRVRTEITFDDGNLSDLEIGAPALARYGWTGRFFVLADRIGQPGSLGENDLRQLRAEGHEIGNHGASHVDWRGAEDAALDRELDTARGIIAEASGQPVVAAAIPFGRYDARVLRSLRRHGYERAYSSDGGACRAGAFPLPRTSPRADMPMERIEALLTGREPMLPRIRRAISRSLKRRI